MWLRSLIIVSIYRLGNLIYKYIHIPVLRQIIYLLYKVINLVIVKVLLGVDLPGDCVIGKKLKLAHGGIGVVIHSKAIIGEFCTLYQQVTIGSLGYSSTCVGKGKLDGVPTIGNNVLIGAGAKLLGPIYIGDGARIGANAVVLIDVPPNTTAVGVPAKIKYNTLVKDDDRRA